MLMAVVQKMSPARALKIGVVSQQLTRDALTRPVVMVGSSMVVDQAVVVMMI